MCVDSGTTRSVSGRIPGEWTHVGRVDPYEHLELTFALKQQNVNLLEQQLRAVSDPDSAQYGEAHTYATSSIHHTPFSDLS